MIPTPGLLSKTTSPQNLLSWKLRFPPNSPCPSQKACQGAAPPPKLKTPAYRAFKFQTLDLPCGFYPAAGPLPLPGVIQECFSQIKPSPLLLIWLDLTYCISGETRYQGIQATYQKQDTILKES